MQENYIFNYSPNIFTYYFSVIRKAIILFYIYKNRYSKIYSSSREKASCFFVFKLLVIIQY